MSKVIFNSKTSEPKYIYQVTCEKCNSVIQLEEKEMIWNYDQRERDEWWHWICPVCGQYHQIGSKVKRDSYKIE